MKKQAARQKIEKILGLEPFSPGQVVKYGTAMNFSISVKIVRKSIEGDFRHGGFSMDQVIPENFFIVQLLEDEYGVGKRGSKILVNKRDLE